jgi:formate hydrogenlyase subunit 3/multisubunit Na+/H+ antiporter MnhD subunit
MAVFIALEVNRSGKITCLNGFLRADALSALVVALTAFVALVCAIYAGRLLPSGS